MSDREECPYSPADIGRTFTVPHFGPAVLTALIALNGLGDRAIATERAAATKANFRTVRGRSFAVTYRPREG